MGGDWLQTDVAGDVLKITVDLRIYSIAAVLRTAYWFTDRAYVFVGQSGDDRLDVGFKNKPPTLESPVVQSLSEVVGEFGNSLLDHQLREEIEARTGKIRELLVSKALGEAGISTGSPPGSPNDSVADRGNGPLAGIGR